MSTETQGRDVLYTIVSTDASNVTDDGTLVETYLDLNDGEVALLDEENNVCQTGHTDLDDTEQIRFVKRQGDKLIKYPWFYPTHIKSINTAEYDAPSEQIFDIGYNGSAGSLEAIDSNQYSGQIHFQGRAPANHEDKLLFDYDSDDSADPSEVAIGLVKSLYKNSISMPEKRIHVGAIMDEDAETAAGTGGFSTAVSIEHGLKTFDSGTGASYTTTGGTAASLDVGMFVRFADATGATLDTESEVYRIEGLNGQIVTLDRPIASESGDYDASVSDVFTNATAAAAEWGVRITGLPVPGVNPKSKRYYKNRFKVVLSQFGDTTRTHSQDADGGIGYGESVRDYEHSSQFNLGNQEIGNANWESLVSASPTSSYDLINIQVETESNDSVIQRSGRQMCEYQLAFERGTAAIGTAASYMAENFDTLNNFSVSF